MSLVIVSCSNHEQKSEGTDEAFTFEMTSTCLVNTPEIGVFEGHSIFEGGFSGLIYIPGSDLEFFTVSDRGPNTSMKYFLKNKNVMLFPFPDYTQKIIRLKLEKNQLKIQSIHPILAPDGSAIGGLPPSNLNGANTETAALNLEGQNPKYRAWNFDLEGISIDASGNLWLADEYRPAVVHVDGKTFQIIEVFTPQSNHADGTKIFDDNFAKRQANRGFEGVSVTPSGKIIAMLQSPIQGYETLDSLPTRLVRILHFDPKTAKSKVFGYEMSEHIIDPKIGDISSISEHELLIIEHGKDSTGKVANIYRLDIEYATDLSQMNFGFGTSFEDLKNNAKAQYRGIILAQKSHFLDLIAAGFDPSFGKPEGLTIINGSTLALVNDNDFGIDKLSASGELVLNRQPNCLYLIRFNKNVFGK